MTKRETGLNKIVNTKLLRLGAHDMLVDYGYIATRNKLGRLLHERVDKLEYKKLETFYNDLVNAILEKNRADFKAKCLILDLAEEDLKIED